MDRILRVTDSSGEAILAVEDLVHEDHIVIHATKGGAQAAPVPGPADEHHPGAAPSPPAHSSAPGAHGIGIGGKSRALHSVVAEQDTLSSTGSLNLSHVVRTTEGANGRSHELASRLQELLRGASNPKLDSNLDANPSPNPIPNPSRLPSRIPTPVPTPDPDPDPDPSPTPTPNPAGAARLDG